VSSHNADVKNTWSARSDLSAHGHDGRRARAAGAINSTSTRTGRAWGWISFGLALLVAATVFALQNLKGVDVTFLSFHGQLPLAVLLLVVAVLGSLAVFAFGAARVLQLRLHTRRLGRELSKRGD